MGNNKADLSELRIQQECYMWFHNSYPHLRGLFFRIKNEGTNKISGAIGKATGIIPGVGDSCLLLPYGPACFIEFKTPTGKQSPIQKKWCSIVTKAEHMYVIVRTVDEFKTLCQTLELYLKQ